MYQRGFQNSPRLVNALSTHDDNTPLRKREADKTFRVMDYLKRASLNSYHIYKRKTVSLWNLQMNLKVMVCSCDLRVCTSKIISILSCCNLGLKWIMYVLEADHHFVSIAH